MALTVTKSGDWCGMMGNLRYARVTLAFDSSYPTGGEALTAADLGLRTIDFINVEAKNGYSFEYDYTNSKLKVYAPVDVQAGAGTAGVNNYLFKGTGPVVEVDGTGTAFQLAGAEVLDTTSLAALTGVRVFAIGV